MSIKFENIHKSFNGIDIFNNLEGKIHTGEKVGIIGANGVGKTTLVKILMGIEEHDNAQYSYIEYQPHNQIFSYLKQNDNFPDNESVSKIIQEFSTKLNSECNTNSYLKKIKSSLMELGFRDRDLKKKYKHLSGGEKTRLSLCIALIKNPDVLVLDEPTNNLDMKAISWLEKFINSIETTVIIISHDRYFLDKTVTRIIEMKRDLLKEYKGNYSNYKLQKSIKIKDLQRQRKIQNRELKLLEKNSEEKLSWFFKANALDRNRSEFSQGVMKHTSNKQHRAYRDVQIKIKRIHENRVEIPKEDMSAVYDLFNKLIDIPKHPKYLVKVNRLKKAFGTKVIFDNAALNISTGDKIALLGANGTGKTTFIKMLMNLEPRDSGTIMVNPSLKIGYFSQEIENLNHENTVQQEIMDCGLNKKETNNLLACFLFKLDALYKKVGNLSMGERSRLSFCKLLASKCNFLVLDEPTNHMDLISRETIENALKNYKGTMLFVSHDRYFAKALANKVVTIEDHKLISYEGDYDYYLEKMCANKEKARVGDSYNFIHANIIRLECALAVASSELGKKFACSDEKEENLNNFFALTHELEQYREMLNS
ncbi:ribosomal protection-like ABC-F family protein [Oceanirhabdus seepicola]|uniref:ABC-F family ATP-binding cassette domain-containing protein n=1 Tax=Oceanirhabdus seepicola TaxID=2828781 RepID=A0A9J6NZ16_9CLOT|nr:ABC-F family ATP-binding cassette domain-containing protein [Oceanirhabdus seepicola]MCM1989222.1 ABC-F family ATP-binding cassette domain-containing protein [Oceanirhabdus seepicola]